MAFVKIEKGLRRIRGNIPEVRLGAYRGKQGRVVYIAISEAACEMAGWTIHQTEGKKRRTVNVMINEGVGDDAGFWLFTEDEEFGYSLGADHVSAGALCSSVLVTRFQHYLLNDSEGNISTEEVASTVDEKEHTILVQCPDWLRYNPQSYQEPEKPKVEERRPAPRPPLELVPPRGKDKHRRRA